MIETEVLKIQIVSVIKLAIAGWLLFLWIPKRVFPQEYIDNSLDRVMFNIIHMTALIALIFPFFVYLKVFGLLFMILFFIALRLLFIRYYYRRRLTAYLSSVYDTGLIMVLYVLSAPRESLRDCLSKARRRLAVMKSGFSAPQTIFALLCAALVIYALYLRLYRGLISLVGALPDMYQYFFWGNLLKNNILFARETMAPYMWSGPVLVHTTNLLANLNTVVMYNIFPLLFLSFMMFSIYYFLKRLLESGESRTASVAVAVILFGIVIPSPLAQDFLGLIYKTLSPEVTRLSFASVYFSLHPKLEDSVVFNHINSYWRTATTLPYEMAASFFLANLYFLIKYLDARRTAHLLLYAESLAIVFSTHGGVAVPLAASSLLIFAASLVSLKVNVRQLMALSIAILAATVIGNLWLLQLLRHPLVISIGPAAPFLDTILNTKSVREEPFDTYLPLIFPPVDLLIILAIASLFVVAGACFVRNMRFALASVGLVSLGVVSLYCATNLGLPALVGHERLVPFVAYSYAIVFATSYYLLIERGLLKVSFRRISFSTSVFLMSLLSVAVILLTPRWIDTKEFWDDIYYTEYKTIPYLVYELEDRFQPFTYTVVSYVQELPQVINKGYHVNTQDLLQEYSPMEETLRIPTEYVLLFVENEPQHYRGTGEFWYRWRRDIMLKIKDWITMYGQCHNNMRLWYSDTMIEVYLIDNRQMSGESTYPVLLPSVLTSRTSQPPKNLWQKLVDLIE